jgi:Tol biopolymer transport system component
VPLTRALAADTDPVWSPDGRSVLFRSMQSGRPTLYTRLVGIRDAPDEPVREAEIGDTATDWMGNRVLVHTAGDGRTGADIWVVDRGAGSRAPVAADGFNETDGRWSPDGTWLAYVSDESGRPDIYARGGRRAAERVRVSFAGGSRPRWSADGRSIFFARGSRIMRADRAAGDTPRFSTAVPVFDAPGLRDFDVAQRSNRLAVLVAAPSSIRPAIGAIVNWTQLDR